MAIKTTIQLRRDTLTNWENKNPVLAKGEIALVDKNNVFGVDTTKKPLWVIRIGDGSTDFKNLPETAYALSSDVASEIEALSVKIYKDIDDLTGGDLSNIKGDISTLSGNIVTLNTEMNAVELSVQNLSGYVKTLNETVTDSIQELGDDLTVLNDTVAAHAASLSAVSDKLTPLEGQVQRLETALSGNDGITTKVGNLESNLTGVTNRVTTAEEEIDALQTSVGSLTTNLNSLTSDTLPTLSTSLEAKLDVTISKSELSADTYCYTVKQGGTDVGIIEIPHDVFVDKGEISVIGDETYLLLTLNNDAETVLSVNVASLVDVYTAMSSDTIDVTIDQFKVMASIKDGSITPAKLSSTDTFIFDCGGADLTSNS